MGKTGPGLGIAAALMLMSAGCSPDTDALKAQIKEEVAAEQAARVEALEARVEALELKAQGFEVVRAPSREEPTLPTSPAETQTEPGARDEGDEPPTEAPTTPPTEPKPTPPAEPTSLEAPPPVVTDSRGLVLKRLVAAPRIVDREPSEPRATFTQADDQIHCFMEFGNKGNPARKVTVVWSVDGAEFHRHTLDVASTSRYRTHARARISPTRYGRWSCEVQNEAGERLGQVDFNVSGG